MLRGAKSRRFMVAEGTINKRDASRECGDFLRLESSLNAGGYVQSNSGNDVPNPLGIEAACRLFEPSQEGALFLSSIEIKPSKCFVKTECVVTCKLKFHDEPLANDLCTRPHRGQGL